MLNHFLSGTTSQAQANSTAQNNQDQTAPGSSHRLHPSILQGYQAIGSMLGLLVAETGPTGNVSMMWVELAFVDASQRMDDAFQILTHDLW